MQVIVLYAPEATGFRFVRTALGGVGGEGYLWFGGDSFAASRSWQVDNTLATDVPLRQRVLK